MLKCHCERSLEMILFSPRGLMDTEIHSGVPVVLWIIVGGDLPPVLFSKGKVSEVMMEKLSCEWLECGGNSSRGWIKAG